MRRQRFRLALKLAARRAAKTKQITQEEFDAIQESLRRPVRSHPEFGSVNILEEIQDSAEPEDKPRDFREWLDWLIENLPAILEIIVTIISIFAMDAPAEPEPE